VFLSIIRGRGLYCGANRGAGGFYKSARGLRTESELQMGNEIYLI